MNNDKATREKLLSSAKQEFMEKGYMQASLRNICKKAGVTTGALYFFFQDKEDLFASLVEEPLNKLYLVMKNHYEEERKEVEKGIVAVDDISSDIEAAKQVVQFMYQYYDEFQLILTKSQGSRFSSSIDGFVGVTEKHYRIIAEQMAEHNNVKPVDDFMIHWMAHTHIEVFIHMLTHEISEKKAIEHMETVIKYFIAGWNRLFYK